MRRIVIFEHLAADGSFAAKDGGLDWVVQDPEIAKGAVDGMPGADTILFGRRTYELFERFWPQAAAADAPTPPDPHGPAVRSAETRAMAVWLSETPKLVFSRTRKDVTWRNSRLVPELDPQELAALKRRPGKDLLVFGSGSLVAQLTEHGLVDEYQFVVSPILLGGGRPLLGGLAKNVRLELLEARSYASGNVKLRFARAS